MTPLIKTLIEQFDTFAVSYQIAEKAHNEQSRKDGKPYMTHIDAVIEGTYKYLIHECSSLAVSDDIIECVLCVAADHDAYEDHPDICSLEYILSCLLDSLPQERAGDAYKIKNAIRAISKLPKGQENYADYCVRVKNNEWSRIVKMADLNHNMSDLNAGNLKDKYQLTYHFLIN